jgi:hypothetical protein
MDSVPEPTPSLRERSKCVTNELRELSGYIAVEAFIQYGFDAARGFEQLVLESEVSLRLFAGPDDSINLTLEVECQLKRN